MLDRAKPGHSSLVDDRELAPAFLEHQREGIAQSRRGGDGRVKGVVAVGHGEQLVTKRNLEIPTQAHDVFMDKIITEQAVYPGRGRQP